MGLESVDRMVSVLDALRDGGDASLNDVCERTGLSRSTASRFLNALAEHGFVHRSETAAFSLGPAPAVFAQAPLGHKRLQDAAHRHMRQLADDIGEAVCVSVLEGRETQTIHQVSVAQPVFVENWVDRRWPIKPSGSAISILSTWSPDGIAEALQQLGRNDRKALLPVIEAARANPVSWSVNNYVAALTSVSAPIPDPTGRATAALIIYGPSFRFPRDRGKSSIEKRLTASAAAIAKDLY